MRAAATSAGILCALFSGTTPAQESDPFTELYARAREVENNLVTLRADFVETTESDLLNQPIVERGTMVAARPMRVLLRYQEPEEKLLLIDGDELRVVWLERIELTVADDTLYLVKMRFVYPGGAGSKTIELANLRANVPVEDEEFTFELPLPTVEKVRFRDANPSQ